ncbi:ATP-dependent DNA ligase [Vandammella animalimorsus]|uniref:ATP-dependent DNA ligase n=1 Tax=Vandammella animalimorsus TaxID=2029117 RepID=UPI00325BF37B
MQAFARLYHALDASTSSHAKQAALLAYLRAAPAADAAWAIYFLAGGKPRQLVPTRLLRQWAQEAAGLPEWLFNESYEAVGDLAETISLLLPAPGQAEACGLADWMEQEMLPLRGLPPHLQKERLLAQWQRLAPEDRLPCLKLMTGALRVGVSKLQVTQALAALAGVDAKLVAQRLMGYTAVGARPGAPDYLALIAPADADADGLHGPHRGQPYPFFLAHPLAAPLAQFDALLGPPAHWLVEWKWDGIRAQLVRRGEQAWLWSRGEELVTERFPELHAMALTLPEGTVIDGEIVVVAPHAPPASDACRDDVRNEAPDHSADHAAEAALARHIQAFAQLQKRLGRKTVGPKILRELPAALLAYDLLELGGQDLRAQPQHQRRAQLQALLAAHPHPALLLSPQVQSASWADLARQRERARALGTEGFMLKHRQAAYGTGRTKSSGIWWKWKVDPMSVDAVLIYAQRGHGRRASLYTDYTFAVWSGPPQEPGRTLVPFAKAYSGLTDAEIAQVDAIVRKTTRESFGPVRSVEPSLVFEIGFEGIAPSPRHKSGLAVRFPRMLRWRQDKPIAEADTLASLHALMPAKHNAAP